MSDINFPIYMRSEGPFEKAKTYETADDNEHDYHILPTIQDIRENFFQKIESMQKQKWESIPRNEASVNVINRELMGQQLEYSDNLRRIKNYPKLTYLCKQKLLKIKNGPRKSKNSNRYIVKEQIKPALGLSMNQLLRMKKKGKWGSKTFQSKQGLFLIYFQVTPSITKFFSRIERGIANSRNEEIEIRKRSLKPTPRKNYHINKDLLLLETFGVGVVIDASCNNFWKSLVASNTEAFKKVLGHLCGGQKDLSDKIPLLGRKDRVLLIATNAFENLTNLPQLPPMPLTQRQEKLHPAKKSYDTSMKWIFMKLYAKNDRKWRNIKRTYDNPHVITDDVLSTLEIIMTLKAKSLTFDGVKTCHTMLSSNPISNFLETFILQNRIEGTCIPSPQNNEIALYPTPFVFELSQDWYSGSELVTIEKFFLDAVEARMLGMGKLKRFFNILKKSIPKDIRLTKTTIEGIKELYLELMKFVVYHKIYHNLSTAEAFNKTLDNLPYVERCLQGNKQIHSRETLSTILSACIDHPVSEALCNEKAHFSLEGLPYLVASTASNKYKQTAIINPCLISFIAPKTSPIINIAIQKLLQPQTDMFESHSYQQYLIAKVGIERRLQKTKEGTFSGNVAPDAAEEFLTHIGLSSRRH